MYNPALHTATNKPIGVTGKPLDARSYFYDTAAFAYRPYATADEVLGYLIGNDRIGQFSIIISTAGVNAEWWFKDGIADEDLVLKESGIDPADFIQNQNASDQNANFRINGGASFRAFSTQRGNITGSGFNFSSSGNGQSLLINASVGATADNDVLSSLHLNGSFNTNSGLATATITDNGGGYTDGEYTNVPVIDARSIHQGATLALATVIIVGGEVTSFTFPGPVYGAGYSVNDNLTINPSDVGATGSGFAATVATLHTYSGVKQFDLISDNGAQFNGPIVATGLEEGTIASGKSLGLDEDNNVVLGDGGGGITELTGDATAAGTGSVEITLAEVNEDVGSFTNANITVNAKGQITAAQDGTGGIPVVSSGEKVVTQKPDGTHVDYDTVAEIISAAPLTSADFSTGIAAVTGMEGQKAFDNNYIYYCIGTNQWRRQALNSSLIDLYLADIDDSAGDKTSAQLQTAYPSSLPGQQAWGVNNLYIKKTNTGWKKIAAANA